MKFQHNKNQYLHHNLIAYANPSNKEKYNQWDLINHHKIVQQNLARTQSDRNKQQKRKIYANQLMVQMKQKKQKQLGYKKENLRHFQVAQQIKRRSNQQQQIKLKQHSIQKREINELNKFLNRRKTINSTSNNSNPNNNINFIDSCSLQQIQRNKRRQQQRRQLAQEHQKQINERNDKISQARQKQKKKDEQYLKYQIKWFKQRNQRQKYKFNNVNKEIQQKYVNLIQKQKQKEQDLYYKLVKLSEEQKKQEQDKKTNQKKLKLRQDSLKLKEYLQYQIQQRKNQEQKQKQNPEENKQETSLIQKMLFHQKKSYLHRKQTSKEFIRQLQKQMQQNKMKKQENRYMNQEEYKYNANHLNSLLDGTYSHKVVDRSLYMIGHDKQANSSLLNTDFKDHFKLNTIKDKIQELNNKSSRQQSKKIEKRLPYLGTSLLF